jgi:hypothetical protein
MSISAVHLSACADASIPIPSPPGAEILTLNAELRNKAGEAAFMPDEWALILESNVNLYNLQNLALVSLHYQVSYLSPFGLKSPISMSPLTHS